MRQSSLFPNTSDTSNKLNVLQGLPSADVYPLALRIVQLVEPLCLKVAIAGSLRRLKQTVNDVDIVVLPKPLHSCWTIILKTVRKEFGAISEKQGDKLATLYLPFASSKGQGHVQVDFYRADPTTWGILLLVRTGSKEHNVKLCNLAIQKGLRLQYSVGLTNKDGNVVAGRTEQEVFEALDLPYIEPKDREVEGGLE